MKKLLFTFLFCGLCCLLPGKELKNNTVIMAGGSEGLDRMSYKTCYSHKPVGWAYITDKTHPDFFVYTSRGIKDKGLWLCTPDGFTPDGQRVYKQEMVIPTIWPDNKMPGCIKVFQDGNDIYLLALNSKLLTVTRWDGDKFAAFCQADIAGLSRITDFDIIRRDKKTFEMVVFRHNGESYRPEEDSNAKVLSYYNGAGIYRGKLPRAGVVRLFLDNDFKQISTVEKVTADLETIQGPSRIACVRSADGKYDGYVIGGNLGAMKFIPYCRKIPKEGVKAQALRNADGTVFTSRAYSNQFISYPSSKGDRSGLLCGGECATSIYSLIDREGPKYSSHNYIWERNAPLYGGSLTVPNVVDWDGDGALDIVTGNSEGRLLFFKNNGTSAQPDFASSVELESDGEPIRMLPGYNIVQGPFEGAWGYLCPTVFDWNGDGLPDVVFSGSRSRYEVMLNEGTRTEPRLGKARVIRFDNMELHGTWRVRPAIYSENGETYMLILDDENALHRYRRLDDTNVEDDGKIRLTDGRQITGNNNNNEGMGQWGRGKMSIIDWDGDGDLDLFIGTVKRSCYPSPDDGLPFRRFKKKEVGMQVLYFENKGNFVLEDPVQLQIDGKDVYLGAHSNAPSACMLGDTSHGPNLVVGCESGKFWFFEHSHITYIK